MPLPPAVARFNRDHANRFVEPLARRLAGFAVVHHRGRRSGSAVRTPVNVFPSDGDDADLLVALTYGPGADWVRNVAAGGGVIERGGVRRDIAELQVVGRAEAWPHLPRLVRGVLRILQVRDFARLTVAERT